MKYLKTYENYKSFIDQEKALEKELEDIEKEYEKKKKENKYKKDILRESIYNRIIDWMKSKGLDELDVIYGKDDPYNYYSDSIEVPEFEDIIFYDDEENEESVHKIVYDGDLSIMYEEWAVLIPLSEFSSYEESIKLLKYIESLTPEMIEEQKMKHESKKFNL